MERTHGGEGIVLLGIPTRGVPLARRLAEWIPPLGRYKTGVFAKYAALVTSAAEGAITTTARLR